MRFEFDRKGLYVSRLPVPRNVAGIQGLATTFCAHEATLLVAERNPHLPRISELLALSKSFNEQKVSGGTLAVISSEEAKRLNVRAKGLVRQIHDLLSGLFAETPERATEWGFDVRQSGSHAGWVLMPTGPAATLKTLGKYFEKETSRPVGGRFALPLLTEVQHVYEGLCTSLETRAVGTTTRKTGVAGSYEVAEALLDYLQAAMVHLLVTKFDRKVTPELGLWGFDVIARPAKSSNGDGEVSADGGVTPGGIAP